MTSRLIYSGIPVLLALIWIYPAQAQQIDASLSALYQENLEVGDARRGYQATVALGGDHLGLEAAFSGSHVQKDLAAETQKWNRHSILIGPRITSPGEDLRFYGRVLGGVTSDRLNGSTAPWQRAWLAGGGARFTLDRTEDYSVGLRIGMDYLKDRGNMRGIQISAGFEVGR